MVTYVTKCRHCNSKWVAMYGKEIYCTECGYNSCWQGPEYEKYSGPEKIALPTSQSPSPDDLKFGEDHELDE